MASTTWRGCRDRDDLRILGTRREQRRGDIRFGSSKCARRAQDLLPLSDLARLHAAVASSVAFGSASFGPANAVDGDVATRWSSEFSDDQWICVDLSAIYAVQEVILRWETAFGAAYQVQVSDDASSWQDDPGCDGRCGGVDDLTGLSGTGR